MKFNEFWPLYLRAHRLPGTRAMHYFATAVGVTSAVEAVAARQPMFLVGIGLGYAIAIGAHRFIEGNKPLIRVNALWGAIADLRMVWLALTGGLDEAISRNRPISTRQPLPSRNANDGSPTTPARPGRDALTGYVRFILLAVSGLGLAAGLLDLDDLFEVGSGLRYPLIQLGAPIAAFFGALSLGISALAASHIAASRSVAGVSPRLRPCNGVLPMSTVESSLWRACVALVLFGALALVAVELAEHGFSTSTQLYLAFGAATTLLAIAPVALLNVDRDWEPPLEIRIPPKPKIGTALCRRVGYFGGTICTAGGICVLGWQILQWLSGGVWHPMSLSVLLSRLEIFPARASWESADGPVDWVFAAPGSMMIFIVGVLLLTMGFEASVQEKRRLSDWLFRQYLKEARGSDDPPR